MRLPCCVLLGLLAFSLVPGRAIERLPIDDFAREPATSGATLSPDGKRIAFLRDYAGRTMLHIGEIDGKKVSRLDLGEAPLLQDAPKQVADYYWVSDTRLLIVTQVWDILYGVLAVDWDGRHDVPISGYEDNKINLSGAKDYYHEVAYISYDKTGTVLMLDRHEDGFGNNDRPDIMRVNTRTGLGSVEIKNPGEVASWVLDFNGVARLGILSHGELSGAIYREKGDAPWRTILPLQRRAAGMQAVGFDAASGRPLVAALTPESRWTVFPLNPATGELGQALLADPEYDIVPPRPSAFDRVALAATLFSPARQALIGIRYYTDALRVKWFDREFAAYQAALDRAMPDTVNVYVESSRDGKRQLWLCFSDQNPGVYMLLDVEKHKLMFLGSRMKWIEPAKMAPMLAIKYAARDGLTIHGYLTVPAGHQPKNLPLVVMPHGGPWVRDVWGFDPLVQLLANRGYAVLQMNYRGSPGYGEEMFRAAHRQIGKAIQDDIEDATRWAIAAGVADPQHIAIVGGSYGGYSALFALGHNPELYRCGISLAGVTDWPAIYDTRKRDEDYEEANRYWRREIGDRKEDAEFLASISPVNFADKITAPVLIIQGKEDRTVPRDQAKRMIAALEKTGRKPESLFVSGLGHEVGNEKQRKEVFAAVVGFLEKNLGPGVP